MTKRQTMQEYLGSLSGGKHLVNPKVLRRCKNETFARYLAVRYIKELGMLITVRFDPDAKCGPRDLHPRCWVIEIAD